MINIVLVSLRDSLLSWKPYHFPVCESSKIAVDAQSRNLDLDRAASDVVTEVLELVTDTDADQIPELADSGMVNVFFLRVSSGSKSTRSSSYLVLLLLRDRGPSRRFGGRRMLSSKITWLANCSSAPRMHLAASCMPQRYRHVPKWPTPVLAYLAPPRDCVEVLSQAGSKQPGWLNTGTWLSSLCYCCYEFNVICGRNKPPFHKLRTTFIGAFLPLTRWEPIVAAMMLRRSELLRELNRRPSAY